jgi:wyosine [tRNA(Phe)-imidazoG37] synthetase (radical SAM superfamily)
MSFAMFANVLRELQVEGVESIQFVHFEGRGDPMMNPHLGEMVAATKCVYPDSFTAVTTHGNYPFKRWLLDSGLDVLRLSIDGARQASYEKYRVGGNLRQALDLMRQIRDERHRTPSRLRVEWKYLLFEWNDSDDEIREAAKLSDELEVRLRFCLTHTDGKSKRFSDLKTLRAALQYLAPKALEETTFQLKTSPTEADVGLVSRSHYVEGSLDEEQR